MISYQDSTAVSLSSFRRFPLGAGPTRGGPEKVTVLLTVTTSWTLRTTLPPPGGVRASSLRGGGGPKLVLPGDSVVASALVGLAMADGDLRVGEMLEAAVAAAATAAARSVRAGWGNVGDPAARFAPAVTVILPPVMPPFLLASAICLARSADSQSNTVCALRGVRIGE